MNCFHRFGGSVLSLLVAATSAVPVWAQKGAITKPKSAPKMSAVLWKSGIEERIESLLRRMMPSEKLDLLGGTGFGTKPIPRLGIPAINMTDGPNGARGIPPSTAYAAGLCLAATFDREIAQSVGREIGRDTRSRDSHIILGPGVNILRSPRNGRNFEYFGEDPYLSAQIAVGYIRGVQSVGVSATIKHFVGNESEFARNTSDSIIDERTLREIYLPPFEAAVKEAKVGAVMDSYNKLNGDYLTQNSPMNRQILKNEWGFSGVLMSDWFATHDTLGAANNGMDLEMPSGRFLNEKALTPLIADGTVKQSTIDDKVRRILRLAARMGWLDRPILDRTVARYNQEGRKAALQGAREGITLLKNQGSLLPLNLARVKTIAVIGPDAYPAVPTGGGSGRVVPFAPVSILGGLSDALAGRTVVTYARGLPTLAQIARATHFTTDKEGLKPGLVVQTFDTPDFKGEPVATRTERNIAFGRAFFETIGEEGEGSGFPDFGSFRPHFTRWTGFYNVEKAGDYELFANRSDEFRVFVDDKLIIDDWNFVRTTIAQRRMNLSAGAHKIVFEEAKRAPFGAPSAKLGIYPAGSLATEDALALAKRADVVVIAVGFDHTSETEGTDRDFNLPPGQSDLINAVAKVNKNVIVAITSGGSIETESWRAAAKAILELYYPGQEGGTALAEILLGKTNPSGRLPFTWDAHIEDAPANANYYYTDPATQQIPYKEGVFVGYRAVGRGRPAPLYPFGYGLSYTTFAYSRLTVVSRQGGGKGGSVTFDVKNTGETAGGDVPQVYISDRHAKVPRPLRELKGFSRVNLASGATTRVTIPLDARAFCYWDIKTNRWRADAGDFEVQVGRSSQDIVLRQTITLPRAISLKP